MHTAHTHHITAMTFQLNRLTSQKMTGEIRTMVISSRMNHSGGICGGFTNLRKKTPGVMSKWPLASDGAMAVNSGVKCKA